MGFFSGGYVTRVGTSISRVIEDGLLPNSPVTGALRSLVSGDGQLVENIMEEMAGSLALRADRMYDFARKKYPYGVPYESLHSSFAGKDIMESVLADEFYPATVEVEYFRYGPPNNLHFGWEALVNEHGYQSQTNEITGLSAAKGRQVYLKDMQVVVTNATLSELENGSLEHWGASPKCGGIPGLRSADGLRLRRHSPFQVDPAASGDAVRVDYTWFTEEPVLHNGEPLLKDGVPLLNKVWHDESMLLPVPAHFSYGMDYYQVKYTSSGQDGYRTYFIGDGSIYPELEVLHQPRYVAGEGTYFPFIYFRYDKQAVDGDKTSAAYLTSKKMLELLQVNYQEVIDNINSNPDIADVESALMMMAVPAVTEAPIEQQYLFDYFNRIYEASGSGNRPRTRKGRQIEQELGEMQDEGAVILQDARFKLSLGFQSLHKRTHAGRIGKVGTHASGYQALSETKTGTTVGTGASVDWTTTVPHHYYRRQVTASTYEEIKVYNLRMSYFVWGGYAAVGDDTDNYLLVPLDMDITRTYSVVDREQLYARSLHYVFNSRVTAKVKWYQSGPFQAFMVFIGIIITIISYGTAAKEMIALYEAGKLTAQYIMRAIMVAVVKYIVVPKVIQVFIKELGGKAALLVAILAAVAAAYGQYVDSSTFFSSQAWAEGLLKVASNLVSGVNDSIAEAMLGLMEEAEAFGLFVEEKNKELETAEKLLQSNHIQQPMIIFGEKPDDFFERTVHSGNIGTLGIEAISSYVDMALTLPKLSNTVGD